MLNLSDHLDPVSGFCSGVVYAIKMAEETLDRDGTLCCVGNIVHSDEEVKRLEKKGLQVTGHEDLENIRDVKVLTRARGEPPSTCETAAKNTLELIDASGRWSLNCKTG